MQKNYIYALIDPRPNKNKIYIGKTNNPELRYKQHIFRLKHNTKKTAWIKKLLFLDLKPELLILDETFDNWESLETYWISQFRTWGFDLVNGTNGGDGGNTFSKLSIDRQNEIRNIASTTMSKTMLNIPKSEEHKKKISDFQKTQKRTDSSNELRSKKLKGRISPNKGNILSEQARTNLGNAHKKNILVLDLDFNIITNGLGYVELSEKLNAHRTYVSNCRREQKLFRGKYWIILEKDLEEFISPKSI